MRVVVRFSLDVASRVAETTWHPTQVIDRSQRHLVDGLGRSLEPLPFGRRIARDGEVWVLGVHRERSWDSRYFGPSPAANIVGAARPLLTLGAGRTP